MYRTQIFMYLFVVVILLTFVSASFAVSVNVDFGPATTVYSGTAASSDTGTTWNCVAGGSSSVSALDDSSGNETTVGITFGTDITSYNHTTPTLAANLMRDYLYAFDDDDFTITGLKRGKKYDLYLYSQNGGSGNATTDITINGTGKTAANNGNVSTFQSNVNYVLYTDVVSDAAGKIKVEYEDGASNAAAVNGFQLVTVEPNRTLSRGQELILDKGFQIQVLNSLRGYHTDFNVSQWEDLNYTTINFKLDSTAHQTELGNMAAGQPWGRQDQTGDWYTGESTYASNCVSIQCYDEPHLDNSIEMAALEDVMDDWRAIDPDALIYTNLSGDNGYDTSDITDFMEDYEPDMLMFDHYRGYHSTRVEWFQNMQLFRTVALQGYDGTGDHPLPYGQYMQMFREAYHDNEDGDGYKLPSETFIRAQRFTSLAFGYTFLADFVYSDEIVVPPDDPVCSVLFSNSGDNSNDKTIVHDYVADANAEVQNLAPALERLVSTDVAIIRGKVGGTQYAAISGVDDWSEGGQDTGEYVDYIESITPLGADYLNPTYNDYNDVVIGYFEPLLADNDGYEFVDGLCFMIVNSTMLGDGSEGEGLDIDVDANGAPDQNDIDATVASAHKEYYWIVFDFSGTDFDSLARVNRTMGAVELVNLGYYGNGAYAFTLGLDGGTGDLFTFWDSSLSLPGVSAVPEPASLALLASGMICLLWRWRRAVVESRH